ncbi:MAG: SoxR reducing system RseC family protein [Prevotella sp.]|nr:SoxR reducing system RseC family protein [Prevotella sp.]
MNDKISHRGVIQSISAKCVEVRITQSSACSSCSVASHCNASETKVKVVEVHGCDKWQSLSVGQEVVVSASRRVAGLALMLGFGVPLVTMLVVIGGVYYATGDEAAAALWGLAALIPYYILLYMMRNKIATKVAFNIE